MSKNKVYMMVDSKFFDNIFEPARKKLEREKGCRFSQPKFTQYLAKNKVKFTFPKQNKRFMPNETYNKRKKR